MSTEGGEDEDYMSDAFLAKWFDAFFIMLLFCRSLSLIADRTNYRGIIFAENKYVLRHSRSDPLRSVVSRLFFWRAKF